MRQSRTVFILSCVLLLGLTASLDAALTKGKKYVVITTSGKVVSGTLVKESEKTIVLKISKKKNVTISKDEIEEIRETKKAQPQKFPAR
jgi:hypothetical protein